MKNHHLRAFYLSAAIPALLTCGGARACDGCFDDWFAPYFQRHDGVTLSAGNAKDQNAISQIIDPTPPYVHDRRLPMNGQRAVGAMERYRDTPKFYGFAKAGTQGGASTTPPPALSSAISSGSSGGGGQ
jgi:hypothetical protein